MKIPSEADLIELENRVLRGWQIRAEAADYYTYEDRICRTLEAVITIARAQAPPIPPMPPLQHQKKRKRPAKLKGVKR